ncbi:Non-ribosomal peptide synthetase modules and related protein [Hahella chejuensis KCTC 2396]|uniref:Non-ribosomal peptide synthetase modules and related protein n=1 Tax=Hahella chejuensis (strain KCTC 2396) TaxID=349521 RepID=Q2SKG0_HAHCH|nr:non-ribosomal peptide synthetase [Hahella chejuensis]ABC28864.1 Non-ribosomal peptide synthetase modules and related protein [Hahella chejuensis KCTC 2396]
MDFTELEAIRAAETYWRALFGADWSPTELKAPSRAAEPAERLVASMPVVPGLMDRVRDAAAEANSTPQQVVLAGWLTALMHLNDLERQTLSVQVDDGAIMPLTFELDPGADLPPVIEQVAEKMAAALSHKAFPYLKLAAEEYGLLPPAQDLLTPLLFNLGEAETPRAPIVMELRAKGEGAELVIQGGGVFASYGYLRRLGAAVINILEMGLVRDLPLSQLELLAPDEITERLQRGTGATSDFAEYVRVEEAFAARVAETPRALAIIHGEISLTYAELDEASYQLAQALRELGVQPGQVVAIHTPRSIPMAVSALAALKAGAVYMPLDPDYPVERIQLLMEDSQAAVLIHSEDAPPTVPADVKHASLSLDMPGGRVCALQIQAPSQSAPADAQAAYLMFTSGTTGRPKGVLNTHAGVLRLVRRATYLDLPPGVRVAQAGATGFDASVFEIWAALLNGGCLQIVDREVLLDSVELARFFRERKTDVALITTSLFSQLASDDPAMFAPLSQLLVGGDVISPKQVAAVYAACPGIVILNAYGPTENGVISTVQRIDPARLDSISIGVPISNSVALVLNRFGRLTPPLFEGELYVGGAGLALGYLGREEDTAKAFVPHPYVPGSRIYRTGDRARWNAEDELEFLGRQDFQIKIRGFRVELGEIEKAALSHPTVNEALVLALKPEGAAEYRLHCYLGVTEGFDLDSWRQQLIDQLPAHMVPAAVWAMPELPLTVNGKVNRRVLAEMRQEESGGAEAADDIERVLLEIGRSLLNLNYLSTDDDLIRRGASSLTAAIIASRTRRDLGVRISVADVLRCGTVAELAALVRKQRGQGSPRSGVEATPAQACLEATPQQVRLFIEQSKQADACHYNLPIWVELPTDIDPDRLQEALRQLVARHEILRTSFEREGEVTRQRIHADLAVSIAQAPAASDVFNALTQFIRPFDWQQGPLWRAALYRDTGKTCLLFDIHHILTDGYSLLRLFAEWEALYRGHSLSGSPLQYRDYACWLASDGGQAHLAEQEAYWLKMYAEKPALPDLPTDFPRSGVRSLNGAFLEFNLGEERTISIRRLTERHQVSAYQFLLACYSVFLAQVTGHDDITIGTPVAGRLAPGVDDIQGMFVNTLCLRLRPALAARFGDYLREVAEMTLGAFDNQDYPFDRLVAKVAGERSYGRSPLFDAMFALQNTGLSKQTFLGGSIVWTPAATGAAIYDLNLQIEEGESALRASWHFNRDLFTTKTLASFRDRLLEIIDKALNDVNGQIRTLNQDAESGPVALPEIEFEF